MFSSSDVVNGVIVCEKSQLVRNPPTWMKAGLQQTASGYGKRLNSGYSIDYEGRRYRVYVTIYSNIGTCWFCAKGQKIIVDTV